MSEADLAARILKIESNVNVNTATVMALTAALVSLPAASDIEPGKAYAALGALVSGQASLSALEPTAKAALENMLANIKMANRPKL